MGRIIDGRTLATKKLLQLPYPILLCANNLAFEKEIIDAGFHNVSLNLDLAKFLLGKAERDIAVRITAIIMNLLPKGPVFLTDYEMLFDPRYKLDVIKLFCIIARHNKLIVQWPGGLTEDTLTYAEAGYDDYASYKIDDYQITCVT